MQLDNDENNAVVHEHTITITTLRWFVAIAITLLALIVTYFTERPALLLFAGVAIPILFALMTAFKAFE